MYAPICLEDYDHPLPVCKNVCQMARDGCAPIMRQYQFAWPDKFECDDLPEQGDPDRLCMHFLNASGDNTQKSTPALPTITAGGNVPGGQPRPAPPSGGCKCGCNKPLVSIPPSSKSWYNRGISAGDQPNCGVPCYDPYFDASKKTFAKFWIALWAGLCCASTFMTVTTFLIDMTRFKYPERPIIFLALCYFFVSLGYIIRLIAGHEAVACEKDLQIVRYGTTGPALCTIVFLLIYFFSMASSIWWVILSFTWFLAAGMKWGQEAIASYAQYFHLAAWLIPSVKTIAVLALSSVDGDPVSGICYVGNQNLDESAGVRAGPAHGLPHHRDVIPPGRIRVPHPDPESHQAGRDQDGQTGEVDAENRHLLSAVHGPSHHRGRVLLLRAAAPSCLGEGAGLPGLHAGLSAGLYCIHVEVLYVPSGGSNVRSLGLDRVNKGVLSRKGVFHGRSPKVPRSPPFVVYVAYPLQGSTQLTSQSSTSLLFLKPWDGREVPVPANLPFMCFLATKARLGKTDLFAHTLIAAKNGNGVFGE
uniref:Frizzled-4 n=1 Tax=Branchiostoma floridae TaxID=7739 RepID=C3YES3_BRAFL|eukprot:XP_002605157.1 hypothetical protein BRAFLDRAFT_122712 [Branchiostoma floridae]